MQEKDFKKYLNLILVLKEQLKCS